MKKHIFILIIIFTFLGCSKDTNNAGGGNNGGGGSGTTCTLNGEYYFKAIIDSQLFEACSESSIYGGYISDVQNIASSFSIFGFNNKGQAMQILFIDKEPKVGAYNIYGDNSGPLSYTTKFAYFPDTSKRDEYFSSDKSGTGEVGKVVISEYTNTYIVGAIYTKCKNDSGIVKEIKSGVFKCKRTSWSEPPPDSNWISFDYNGTHYDIKGKDKVRTISGGFDFNEIRCFFNNTQFDIYSDTRIFDPGVYPIKGQFLYVDFKGLRTFGSADSIGYFKLNSINNDARNAGGSFEFNLKESNGTKHEFKNGKFYLTRYY